MRYSIGVMPITVAALMTPRWLLRHLVVPNEATIVVLPGYLAEHQAALQETLAVEVRCGPKDLRQLPEYFGTRMKAAEVLRDHDIRIIAEINHAPRLGGEELVREAKRLVADGADIVDIGCDPASRWLDIADAFQRLTEAGIVCSVDTFDSWEAERACRHGASLVLSVNSTNRDAAADWGTEVVAIPDTPDDLESLDETIRRLDKAGVPMRLDPILEPIGMALGASLLRYHETRRRYPEAEMMMGIGNLTELTDVDSAGINLMLLALCQEWSIRSVLTTQVINWARSSVRECDLARRLVHYSLRQRTPPKRLDDSLVMLRDPKLREYPSDVLDRLAEDIRDNNYRIFAQDAALHLISAGLHLSDDDPYRLFERLMNEPQVDNVDPSHAFYLGFELAKAMTALTLGKQYEQDQALRWGHLTRPEKHHRIARKRKG
ncbi:MAG: dihydropteroate synthase [Planctomycetaceae bacterium]|nr:MAG: dihydropteroate synthase [Planctomycetaceae bacterium]